MRGVTDSVTDLWPLSMSPYLCWKFKAQLGTDS